MERRDNNYEKNKFSGKKKENYQGNQRSSQQRNYQKNGGFQNKNSNGKPQKREYRGYVGAPYNFIPFTQKLYTYENRELAAHNSVEDNLLSGEITYEITAETPIFIDDGTFQHHFYKNSDGKYCIPGSSMRGLIRNNVQILGFSGFSDDIDDYGLMYRNVANGADKKEYERVLGSKQISIGDENKVSVLLNVRAGYIGKENGRYKIYKTCVEKIDETYGNMNYYVLSERRIGKEYLDFLAQEKEGKYPYEFFVQGNRYRTQHLLNEEFERSVEIKTKVNKKGEVEKEEKVHYRGKVNRTYKPFYENISYNLRGGKEIIGVGKPGKYAYNGMVISTGPMNEKKAVYIIPEIDKENSIDIPQKDIETFRIDIEKRENTLKRFGGRNFFDLPEKDEIKPVFYIELGGRLYFGFTPRLRLFYEHTIKEGLPENQKNGKIDYAKAIFGYSNNSESYKSRVSFSDAVLTMKSEEEKERSLILGEPKPTSYLDYLKQTQGGYGSNTYNTDGFELRGIKQYWLHEKEMKRNENNEAKSNVASVIHPLPKNTQFEGKIRFQNLTEDELGLLLWAVRLEKDSWMNIGKAKAYGYGNISVNITDAKEIDGEKAYLSKTSLNLMPFRLIQVDDQILYYKKFIKKNLKLKEELEEFPRIKNFFMMKDSKKIPSEENVRYMNIGNIEGDFKKSKEYQKRKSSGVPLPDIETVIRRSKNL